MFIGTNVMLIVWHLVEVSAFDLKPQNVHVTRRRLWSYYARYLNHAEASLTFVDFLPVAEEI